MKLLVVASGFVLFLFKSTAGTQCYQCKDKSSHTRCEDVAVETCEPDSSYCATISYVERNSESYVQKACVPKVELACKVGKYVKLGPDPSGRMSSLLCCEGDLCNSSNKLTNQNVLFYAISLSCVFSLVEFLFN